MIGMCRKCKRVLSYEETRCPYCGIERPVELPWEVSQRRPARPLPRALRRWIAVVGLALVVATVLSLCSAATTPVAPMERPSRGDSARHLAW